MAERSQFRPQRCPLQSDREFQVEEEVVAAAMLAIIIIEARPRPLFANTATIEKLPGINRRHLILTAAMEAVEAVATTLPHSASINGMYPALTCRPTIMRTDIKSDTDLVDLIGVASIGMVEVAIIRNNHLHLLLLPLLMSILADNNDDAHYNS